MEGDLARFWQDLSFPDSMGTDDQDVESSGFAYAVYHSPLIANLGDAMGFVPPMTMPIDFPHATPVIDAPYTQNLTYGSLEYTSAHQRQQSSGRLYINTQLNYDPIHDSEGSTASSSSFPPALSTPYSQQYLAVQPSVHNASPLSSSPDSGMLMPEYEKTSTLPSSPLSPYSPSFEGEMLGDPPPMDTEIVTQVQLPHIIDWKKVIEESGMNDFVPQSVYQPYTEADKKRYILDVELQHTIYFHSENPQELGIPLDDALKQRLRYLKDKDDRMFVGCGPSVSIRIQWPGYTPWSKQIPTMDFKTPKGHITRAKLAKNIATCVRRFSEEVQDKPMEAESDRRWKVGKRHIKVEDLILVSLHHVSKGSWQPQLRFRRSTPAIPYQWDESLPSFQTS